MDRSIWTCVDKFLDLNLLSKDDDMDGVAVEAKHNRENQGLVLPSLKCASCRKYDEMLFTINWWLAVPVALVKAEALE